MVASNAVRFFFCISSEPSAQLNSAGNLLKGIVCLLLSGAMDGQNTDAVLVGKLLELTYDFIITGITVHFTAYLTDFLHSVNDDGIGVRVLLYKILQLFIQPIPNLSSGGEVEVGSIVHAAHLKHPALDTLKIIFQRKIKYNPLMNFIPPQILPGTDMVGNLSNQEGLADFGRSGKDKCPLHKADLPPSKAYSYRWFGTALSS